MTSLTPTLDCAAFEARLADYLDGDLPPAARAAAEAHRAACATCAALVADLDTIRERAAVLPELAPSRDLWAGIAARIEAPVVPIAAAPARHGGAVPSWLRRPWLAAAAGLLLVVTGAAVTYRVATGGDGGAGGPVVAAAPEAAAATASADRPAPADVPAPPRDAFATLPAAPAAAQQDTPAPVRAASAPRGAARPAAGPAEPLLDREFGELRQALAQRRGGLDSATVRSLEANLAIIDAAIRESRAALERDPASPFLHQRLSDVLGEKLEVMRTAVMLAGDD